MLVRSKEYKFLFATYIIQRSKWFHLFSFMAIFSNSIVLGLSSYPIDQNFDNKLEIANLVFFVYFVIELIIKIVGQGMKHFVKDKYNIFDSIVVSTSAVDIILQYSYIQTKWGSGAITALRILRLVRMFEIGRVWN